ncbi:MAG: pantoate--beta-alanine ligase, partial [Flavobacteriales bacterium]|nr:pantoate--beta-alanine ligase [Flavobacteriales bacterium]
MLVSNTSEEVARYVASVKEHHKKVALVPTMGALHDGHLSLITKALEHADVVVASIFVNPTQFNEASDLENYPRTIEADLVKLEASGCHVAFMPDVEEIYPEGHKTKTIDYEGLDLVMEGAERSGHFDGVVEVVARLFDIIQPDVACFGEKDFQQLAIIRKLVDEHDYAIDIIPCPIVREPHGLAMSSRNERLTEEQRQRAAILYETLQEMKNLVDIMNPDEVEQWGRDALN